MYLRAGHDIKNYVKSLGAERAQKESIAASIPRSISQPGYQGGETLDQKRRRSRSTTPVLPSGMIDRSIGRNTRRSRRAISSLVQLGEICENACARHRVPRAPPSLSIPIHTHRGRLFSFNPNFNQRQMSASRNTASSASE